MKVFKSDAKDTYDMISPLYYCAKIFGFWPHTLKKQKTGSLTPLNLLYFLFVLSIYIFLMVKNYSSNFWVLYGRVTKSTILTYGQYLQIEGGLILGAILSVMHFVNYKKKWKTLDIYNEIDGSLEKQFFLIIPRNFLRNSIFSICVMANVGLLLVMLIILMFFQILMNMSDYIVYLSNYLANLAYFTLFSQYFCCNLYIRRRFIYINSLIRQCVLDDPLDKDSFIKPVDKDEELLLIQFEEIYTIYGQPEKRPAIKGKNESKSIENVRKVIKEIETNVNKLNKPKIGIMEKMRYAKKKQIKNLRITKESTTKEVIDALSELGRLHELLSYSVKLMNESYSFQLLVITAAIFIFILFGLFSGYRIIFNNNDIQRYIAMANLTMGILYMFTTTIMLIINTNVIKASRSSPLTTHYAMRRIENKEILEKLSSLSQQFYMSIPEYSCGLFPFNWTLFYSTISAGTTYLIILIQFDLGFK